MKLRLLPLFLAAYGPLCAATSVSITTTTLPNGTLDSSYSGVIQASGGCTPYKWAVVSGALPAGVSATPTANTTSLDLTGTPSNAATYSFTISVTGCGGYVSTMSYTVVIQPVSVSITTTTLPNGTLDTSYSGSILASGGCTPYKWAVGSGTLPAGVSATPTVKTTSLTFAGTPSNAATYSFTISVTGCGGHVSTMPYQVVIQPAAVHVVDLSWIASTSNDIAGYNVYRGPDGTTWSKINAALVAATLYDDSTVADGSTYFYAVTAVDTSGKESSKTAAVKAVIP
jgi:hypothetical protein